MNKFLKGILLLLTICNQCFSNFTEEQKEYTRHAKNILDIMVKLSNSKKDDKLVKDARDCLMAIKKAEELYSEVIIANLNLVFATMDFYLNSIDIPFDNIKSTLTWNELEIGKTTLNEVNKLYGIIFYRKNNGYAEYNLVLDAISEEVGYRLVRFVFDKNNVLNGSYFCIRRSFFAANEEIKESINAQDFFCDREQRVSIYTFGNKVIVTSKLNDEETLVFLGTKNLFNTIKKQYKPERKSEGYKIT